MSYIDPSGYGTLDDYAYMLANKKRAAEREAKKDAKIPKITVDDYSNKSLGINSNGTTKGSKKSNYVKNPYPIGPALVSQAQLACLGAIYKDSLEEETIIERKTRKARKDIEGNGDASLGHIGEESLDLLTLYEEINEGFEKKTGGFWTMITNLKDIISFWKNKEKLEDLVDVAAVNVLNDKINLSMTFHANQNGIDIDTLPLLPVFMKTDGHTDLNDVREDYTRRLDGMASPPSIANAYIPIEFNDDGSVDITQEAYDYYHDENGNIDRSKLHGVNDHLNSYISDVTGSILVDVGNISVDLGQDTINLAFAGVSSSTIEVISGYSYDNTIDYLQKQLIDQNTNYVIIEGAGNEN